MLFGRTAKTAEKFFVTKIWKSFSITRILQRRGNKCSAMLHSLICELRCFLFWGFLIIPSCCCVTEMKGDRVVNLLRVLNNSTPNISSISDEFFVRKIYAFLALRAHIYLHLSLLNLTWDKSWLEVQFLQNVRQGKRKSKVILNVQHDLYVLPAEKLVLSSTLKFLRQHSEQHSWKWDVRLPFFSAQDKI